MHYYVRKRNSYQSDKITFDMLSFERSTSRSSYGTKDLTIGERLEESTALMMYGSCCDVSARGLWLAAQVVFLDK